MLPNGNPADETEEYAAWETASHKAQDVAATAWSEVKFASPTHAFRLSWARLRRFLPSRGPKGFEAFDGDQCSIGLFADQHCRGGGCDSYKET